MNSWWLILIIPFVSISTIGLTNPNVWGKHIAWSPIDNNSIICDSYIVEFGQYVLTDCNDGLIHKSGLIIRDVRRIGDSWSSKFYCSNAIKQALENAHEKGVEEE